MKEEIIIYKSTPNTGFVKDVDKRKRIVTGYFSTWGFKADGTVEVDSDGDVIQRGAFAKTIAQNGPMGANRIWSVFNHDLSKPINKPHVLKEDEIGGYFEMKYPNTILANDLLTLYEEGAITEHSMGYNVIQQRKEQNYNILQEIRMWEFSPVLWGANEHTPTTGIKTSEIEMKMKLLDGLLRDGDFSDETFLMIEKMLQDIKTIFSPGEPEAEKPKTKEPTSDPEGLVLNFYKQLNK